MTDIWRDASILTLGVGPDEVANLRFSGFMSVAVGDQESDLRLALGRARPALAIVDLRHAKGLAWLKEIAGLRGDHSMAVIAWTALAPGGEIESGWTDAVVRADDPIRSRADVLRLAAEIGVLRRQLAVKGAEDSAAVRERIDRLREGLGLLQTAHDRLVRELADAHERERRSAEVPAAIVHEFRSPLNAISGFAEIMSSETYGPLGDRRYLDYANSIVEASRHLMRVTNDLLDLYSAQAGQMATEIATVDLADVIDDVTRMFEIQAQKGKLRMTRVVPPGLKTIQTDPGRLKQILVNLVGNAVKFTPSGGSITLRAESPERGSVAVIVADTGPGIPAEDIGRVMQPFGRGKGRREGQGTGLGLPVSKRLARVLGGDLELKSQAGAGTTAIVRLPIKPRPQRPTRNAA